MRTVRLGVLIGVAVVGSAFALNATSCASATTITLDIRTRPELCKSTNSLRLSETGVVVTTEGKVDRPGKSPLQEVQGGCKNAATGSIGTLVITPSGAKNEKVAIRVVAALNDNSASACDDSEGKAQLNCITTKRLTRFVEGSNVPLSIMIEPECNGVECPENLVCVKGGKCAPVEAVPPDPETEVDAAATQDATGVSDVEPEKPKDSGPPPPPPDAGPCSRCMGPGKDCNAGVCSIDCAKVDGGCSNQNICLGDDRLSFNVACKTNKACENTQCVGAKAGRFDCSNGTGTTDQRCKGLQCEAGVCEVICDNVLKTCENVSLAGETNKMTCVVIADGVPSCDAITCKGKSCSRKCTVNDNSPLTDAGCGTTATCTSPDNGCKDFQLNVGFDAAAP